MARLSPHNIWLLLLLSSACNRAPEVTEKPTPITADGAIIHGPRDRQAIALTFDACSTEAPSKYDGRIIEILQETKTPATLFLGGKWMREHPELTQKLAASELFEIGNHSYIHPHMPRQSPVRMRMELLATQHIATLLTGETPRFFRPPYGELNDQLLAIAKELGLAVVMFDLASADPHPKSSATALRRRVLNGVHNGSIVVLHMNGRGRHTAEVLADIIASLRSRGFELVTVGQLLQP